MCLQITLQRDRAGGRRSQTSDCLDEDLSELGSQPLFSHNGVTL